MINQISGDLNNTAATPDLAALAATVKQALRFNAGDARLYSLLGEINYRQGEKDQAYDLFRQAREISKTEIHALQMTIRHSVESGDLTTAVDLIDTLLRRWPDRFPAIASGFPAILSNPEGYQAVLTAIKGDPPWRAGLFSALGGTQGGLDYARQLLLDLAASTTPPKPGELSTVIGGYINQKEYDAAYRLFLFSLSDQERKLGGYVFNGTFAPVLSGKPFDWQIADQSGLEVTFATTSTAMESDGGATVRFLNTPVKASALWQYIDLPSGSYRISLTASGSELKLPKELFWSVLCIDSYAEIARLNVREGTFSHQTLVGEFSINSENCPMQMLRLEAPAIAESWRFRYAGTLVMHKISIERLPS